MGAWMADAAAVRGAMVRAPAGWSGTKRVWIGVGFNVAVRQIRIFGVPDCGRGFDSGFPGTAPRAWPLQLEMADYVTGDQVEARWPITPANFAAD